ncbi:PREDICTED: protein GUCD1-like [Ipomoea nil]|uniref:Guanylyl cyclase n=1 Tax=Ipomoea nil TaxID=35883 RepID=Q0PY32_IPONI|nr:PREDICTED: protein GUCD1-like [Ipomoea nil]ABG67691.2 guanylyl cyclase [Ipomoea nil]
MHQISWSHVWPFCILLSKFMRSDDEDAQQPAGNEFALVGSFPFKQSLDRVESKAVLSSKSFSVEVPHVKQLYTWDCGLACVVMVLRTLGIYNSNIEELAQSCSTTSIWTVDLAYMLRKFSVNFSYFTITIGANPNFCVETFYKEQLPSDLARVNTLFQKAREAGINIECRSISGEEMCMLILSGNCIAIALVDHHKLSHYWSEDGCIQNFYPKSPGYTGHYVVICGYDAAMDEFEIRDPASSRKHEKVTSRRLAEARKSFGTDEDLLLIHLEKGVDLNRPLSSLSS